MVRGHITVTHSWPMTPDRFPEFTRSVADRAGTRSEVVGVVALGSTAATVRQPDQWSDHDMFVITTNGSARAMREDLSWLPDPERIVWVLRETEHGRAVLYDDAHLVELAVFDDDELDVAKVNDYAVVLDRAGIELRMADLAERTSSELAARNAPDAFGELLKQLVVGVSRHARGELLSANERVRGSAARALIRLIRAHVPPAADGPVDNLDAARRLELSHPELAQRLARSMEQPVLRTVEEMIDIVESVILREARSSDPARRAVAVLRTLVHRAQATE